MHISEGVLSAAPLAVGWAVAGAGTVLGLRHIRPERVVKTALISSAFFLSSLIHINLGAASTHLTLIAPMGLVLGAQVFPAVLTALILQALLFHFGGLLVLGANTTIMAGAALLTWLFFARPLRRAGGRWAFAWGFAAGAFGALLGAFFVGLFLWSTDAGFLPGAKVLFAAHLPLALAEGVVTACLVSLFRRVAPDFLAGQPVVQEAAHDR